MLQHFFGIPAGQQPMNPIWIILVIVAAALIVLFILLSMKKKKDDGGPAAPELLQGPEEPGNGMGGPGSEVNSHDHDETDQN